MPIVESPAFRIQQEIEERKKAQKEERHLSIRISPELDRMLTEIVQHDNSTATDVIRRLIVKEYGTLRPVMDNSNQNNSKSTSSDKEKGTLLAEAFMRKKLFGDWDAQRGTTSNSQSWEGV